MSVHNLVDSPGPCKGPTESAREKKIALFAALPHDLAADPRLTPTDVRVLLALLYFARDKPTCFPSDSTLAARIGRSVGTVQRSLKRLVELGILSRRTRMRRTLQGKIEVDRVLVLAWRESNSPQQVDVETKDVSTRQDELKAMAYDDYLATPEWSEKRMRAIEKALGRCQFCNGVSRLQVHHRTYERFAEERPEDLIVLCKSCHRRFHGRRDE